MANLLVSSPGTLMFHHVVIKLGMTLEGGVALC